MPESNPFLPALLQALAEARAHHQRRLVLLCGSRGWSRQLVSDYRRTGDVQQLLWVGEEVPGWPSIPAGKARQVLGQTLELLVYDTWEGIHPDALAAVAGTVGGGGLLVLCAPPLAQWRAFEDPDYHRLLVHPTQIGDVPRRFHQRLLDTLQQDQSVLILNEDQPISTEEDDPDNSIRDLPAPSPLQITADQQQAIDAIVHVLEGHSRRPLVMTSDRGRGKTSALGVASAQLMARGCRQLVITAPNRAAVQPVFLHAAKLLGIDIAAAQSSQLVFGDSCLQFLAPDEVVQLLPAADLLMVDEAAAIPATLLEVMARHYNRMVYATTVHGYEGTGRGFELRFKPTLQQVSNQVRELRLAQPVRWSCNDPVERWLYEALLLDAQPALIDPLSPARAGQVVVEQADREQLLNDPARLKQLFGLLVQAHYQTTPSDLRNLLDGPNVTIWLARYQGDIVAAALIAEEGGFDPALDQQVWLGQRRPRGHLLPQTLAAHAGFKGAAVKRYWRVMRVAVHHECRRLGIGKQLMKAVISQGHHEKIDLFGSSFAATADVMAFWQSLGCVPVRLGVSRDASSGCHSVIVLSGLSVSGDGLLQPLRARFAELFPRLLETTFCQLDASLVAMLLTNHPLFSGYEMSQQDWLDTEVFIQGGRQFADSRLAVWKMLLRYFSAGLPFKQQEHSLLIYSVMLGWNVDAVCRVEGLTGKKQWQQRLQQVLGTVRQCLLAES